MKNDLKERSKKFALNTLGFCKTADKSFINDILLRQLLRSSTSVAANYRAAQRARSKAEFSAKIYIVVEECDESLFWLELITESGEIADSRVEVLKKEALELVKIFNSIKMKIK